MPLEALAQRGPTDAPLMREIARVPNVLPKTADIAAERDQCVRMLVSSSALVKLSLVDASGATRGEPTTVTTAPVAKVPAGGPACVKKGEALRLVVEGAPPGATVRAVVFASP